MTRRGISIIVGILLVAGAIPVIWHTAPPFQTARLSRLTDAQLVIHTTRNPQDAAALTELARRMETSGRIGEALAEYRKVADLTPTDATPWRKVALLAVRQRDPQTAREAAQKLMQIAPDSSDRLRDAATAFAAMGDDVSARSALEKAVQISPGDADAWNSLAAIYTRRNALSDAVHAATRATELAPDSPRFWLHLATAKRLSADAPGAIQAITEATRLDPGDPEIQLEWGILYTRIGRTPEEKRQAEVALTRARDGLRGKTREDEALRRLGQFYLAEKRLPDAEKALRECLRLTPDDTAALFALTRVLALQGRKADADALNRKFTRQNDYELAVSQLKMRLQREPNRADLWARLADLYASHGDTDAADAARSRSRTAAP